MLSIQITNQKDFTSKLFANECFDDMLLESAKFRVFSDFIIDGHVNSGYFDTDDESCNLSFLTWDKYRNICFQMIKGTRKPVSFQIVFRMNDLFIKNMEDTYEVSLARNSITGLYLNIRYESGNIHCTTGISSSTFTMDRTVEKSYEQYLINYLKSKNIDFEI